MKKLSILLLALFFTTITISSCSDDDVKDVVDCFGQNLLTTIDHSSAAETPQQVNFTLNYFGELSLDNSLRWDFGDGTPLQTVNGNTTSHTYTAPGSYHVIAKVSLNNGGCTYDITKTINVQ